MATRNKLKDVSIGIIVELVNRGGQKHAANVLGVAQASISRKLADEKYAPKVVWVKQEIAS